MNQALEIPIAFSTVQAGFPSPADDYTEGHLDIHRHLVKKPGSTIFYPAPDDSMCEHGIFQGDIVLVDQSLKPSHDKIVLVEIDGERIFRRYVEIQNRVSLAVGKKKPVYDLVDPEGGIHIIGVATWVIHPV